MKIQETYSAGMLDGTVEIGGEKVTYCRREERLMAVAMAVEGVLDKIGLEVGRLTAENEHMKARLDVLESVRENAG